VRFSPAARLCSRTARGFGLGLPAGRIAVRSSRSVQEKKPWKNLSTLTGVIETSASPFLHRRQVFPYLTGEPFLIRRALRPSGSPGAKPNRDAAGLRQWWERAEQIWNENRSSERLSLMEQLTTIQTVEAIPVPRFALCTTDRHARSCGEDH